MNKEDLSLYLVTDRSLSLGRPIEDIVEQAVQGGVSMVQLREKNISSNEFYRLASSIKEVLRPFNVPLIINDRLDIALAVDAEGLHIGQSDIPYEVARKLMGKDKIIGLSVENIEQARLANDMDVDYIGVSPVFSTPTKHDIAQPLEIQGLQTIASFSKHPIVGIGGINESNIQEVIKNGADGVALVSAIVSQESPKQAASELKQLIGDAILNVKEL